MHGGLSVGECSVLTSGPGSPAPPVLPGLPGAPWEQPTITQRNHFTMPTRFSPTFCVTEHINITVTEP